jgi:hypothetical protein
LDIVPLLVGIIVEDILPPVLCDVQSEV